MVVVQALCVELSGGDYRGTAESIRQALSALVGASPDVEASVDATTTEFRAARKRQEATTIEWNWPAKS
jgi:hypothetical protein